MRVLFLVHRYPENEQILEKDLVEIFLAKKHEVYVVVPIEKNIDKESKVVVMGNLKILKVSCGNYFTTDSKIEKIISVITRPFFLKKAIKKYFGAEKIEWIFGYTPFMADEKLIKKLKNKYNAKASLVLWDIFPQNAKDLGIIKSNIIFIFYKRKEIKMYEVFDRIICNCTGQVEYILKNKLKAKEKLLLARNSEILNVEIFDKKLIRKNLNIKEDEILALFGGNMGVPQELENIISMAEKIRKIEKIRFLFIGNGTEKDKLKKIIKQKELKNIEIRDFVSREDYESLVKAADIGIISLNKKYTVPNFPAKVTGYCKIGLPLFASLDKTSYKHLGSFIEKNKLGVITEAGNINKMEEDFMKLIKNLKEYDSKEIQKIYKKEFNIETMYEKIIEGM